MKRRLLLALSTVFENRGGIPRFNQMLCLALDRLAPELGLEVTVLSQDDAEEHYRAHGSPWRHARFVPGGGRAGLIRRAALHALAERPHVLLAGLLGMAPLGAMCRPCLRVGYGFVAHGTESWHEPRLTRRWAARHARFAFAVSHDTARALTRATGIAADRVLWLPNTLPSGFDAPSPDEPLPPERGLEILSVSRLWAEEKMKGVDHTLTAFARLSAKHPQARYRIVGKGSDRPRLEALAASLGIADRVAFEQDVPDPQLAARYRDSALFVLPSGQEGFGIVFLEAMRFAKPCIGGNAGGTPEVIADGETGLLVPHGDVDALTEALNRLLSDPALRGRMGRAGRARLVEHFLFDRFTERVRAHLETILG